LKLKRMQKDLQKNAIVTHRLKMIQINRKVNGGSKCKIGRRINVRPTSEAIIWSTYKDGFNLIEILLINRANVVRWEMRTRLF
jgi:prolyl-tRNA synthetase